MEAVPTVVLYPSPGHLFSTVELGKLIATHHHRHPISVVIFITPSPFETRSVSDYIHNVSATTPSITFYHFPAISLPPELLSSSFVDMTFGIPKLYRSTFRDKLVAISEKSTIKAVILDFFSNAAFEISTGLNIPTYYFITGGASALSVFLYLRTIHNTTSLSIKDLDDYLHVPGVPPIHHLDMPSALLDRDSNSYKSFIETSNNLAKSSGIVGNSFKAFEQRAFNAISDGKCVPDGTTPHVYLVGPLTSSGSRADPSENECLKWLELQPSKSVVFLTFGRMGLFKKEQLKEMAFGLEKSGQRFLWVVRNPPPENGTVQSSSPKDVNLEALLPEGFLERTKDKGLVVKNWAPQVQVLSHDSVGGFVTHCGWNSTLEATVAGVPMIAWPLYAEQKMNRVVLVEEIKVALGVKMSADGFVAAEEFEEKLRELMEGDSGRVVWENASEMSKKAKAALEEGGSSRVDFSRVTELWTSV